MTDAKQVAVLVLVVLSGCDCVSPVDLGYHDAGATDSGQHDAGDAGGSDADDPGTRWIPQELPATSQGTVVWDSSGARAVLVAGQELWEWSGSSWSQRFPPGPFPRSKNTPVYDAARRQLVLFGEVDANGQPLTSATWVWRGGAWIRLVTPLAPPARTDAALAFDPVRGRVVLFGGRIAGRSVSDFWEFDGTTWIERRAPAIADAGFSTLTWDVDRNAVVLLASTANTIEAWDWNGLDWSKRSTTGAPAFDRFATAYDPTLWGRPSGRLVLFAGETWELEGQLWSKRATEASEAPGSLVWNPVAGKVLRYGGSNASGLSTDLREWNGAFPGEEKAWSVVRAGPARPRVAAPSVWTAARQSLLTYGSGGTWVWSNGWSNLSIFIEPPRGLDAALASDSTRQKVVLFGGRAAGGSYNDTWEFDGSLWTRRTPALSPSRRSSSAMGFDSARGRVVLFGGVAATGTDETWEWDGTAWSQQSPALSPPGTLTAHLAFDALRRRSVLFGVDATVTPPTSQTWEWDGSAWVNRTPAVSPPPIAGGSLAWNPLRKRVVQYASESSDVWEWDGATWTPVSTALPGPAVAPNAMSFDAQVNQLTLVDAQGTVWRLRQPTP